MPFLLFVAYCVSEIYVLAKVWGAYGFVNVFFALLIAGVLGIGIARNQGRYVLASLQASLARGQVPTENVLRGVFILLAGILLAVPGFVSDFIAILIVLPGSRQLIMYAFRKNFARKFMGGNFRVFTAGSWNRTNPPPPPQESWARDVSPKVIDVKPISSVHQQNGENGSNH